MNGPKRFSVRQKEAIAALFSCRNIQETAQKSRVGVRLLRKWLGQTDFNIAIQEMEIDFRESASRRLLGLLSKSIDTLAELLDDGDPEDNVRLRAAQLIIDMTLYPPGYPQSAEGDVQGKGRA